METGKPGLASAPLHINSTAAQTEKRMDIQAPLMAVYIPTVPALPAQPYTQPPAPTREPATLHLAVPPLYSMETLPFLTLHIAGGLQSQAGLSLAAVSPSARMKSAGKHVCPHCGRDCMKPSVLEKHLRCHTGERPYPCTTCGISFKTQSNLYKHKRTQAHARLSSESDQSCLGSLDSMSCSRETFPSSLSLEESGSMESDTTIPALETTSPTRTGRVFSVKKHVSVSQQSERNPADHETKEPNESAKVTREVEKKRMENKKMLLNASRHLPLQRQEATLFSKQWESSVSRGKSQSHESTDSGFSESSDHHPSPGSILLDHSMDSLTESIKEHLETASELGQAGQEPKQTAREQEQKTLEERISKLISENTAVVEDKQLENVRPRKTVLSKQGSIDLPMPYTYKDSFHFDMRISQNQNVGLQRNRMAGFYSSVPTQHSTTMEPAPLIRSNSLPFSVSLLQPERSTPTSSHQSDYLTLIRRRSSGQINPTGCTSKSVNQQSSTHRPLVRQIAVDCNHATDSLYSSSVEESCTASLSCDRDNGDNFGEPSNRKFRRKKAPKFAYDKWYMYGGGTFKKLYSAEKGGDDSVVKGRKCLTNPDHEVVQGLQKRLSEVHKETVATTGSAVNFTSSSSRVCHPEYPPAKLSHVSAVDFNPKTGHLPPSFSSLTPLRRNLSLSVLPLPLIGSLVNHKTGSLCRAEDGRLIKEKHTVSSSQLCESHIPSDRKKQKTDDKIIFPLETDPNTLTHPPPSVTGSPPQQTSNPTYINVQDNLKHTQLKGVLFPPSIINANTTSISTSPATSTPSAAKTSFLPKYQLKLPNATEPVSNPSPQAVDKSTVTDCCNISSAPPVSLMQSCDIKKTNLFSSTQSQLLLPCTATTLCQAETSSLNNNAKSNLAVVHQQFATATITTTCLHDYQAGLCSSSIQPTKSTGGSVAVQITRPSAPVVANFPATPTITTANNQTSAATITAFSQGQPNHPLSHTQLLPASDQSSPVNRPYVSSNTPIVPCQIVPFDQMQPAAQNVFHVHTADLQICLQIISDEQLALIEPQIERQAGSTLSQRRDMEAAAPEGIQKHAQSLEINNEGKDRSESLVTLNMERIKTQLSEQFGEAEANLQLTEHSNFTQTRVSADSKPPETQILSQRPHNYGNVNTVKETQTVTTSVVPTVASLNSEKSGRSQTSEERPVLSLNCCTEEQLLPDSRVSQGGLASQTVSGQPKLNMTCLSSSTVNQNNMRGEILENENQNKSQNQESKIAKGETSEYNTSKLESGETHSSPQDRLGRTSGASCADELSGSVHSYSINKSKAPGQLNPQASIHCSNPVESTSSGTLNSSQHADMRCDFVSPMNNSTAPLQEITVSESEDIINSAPSEKQQFTSVSSNIQVERPQDIPAVLTDIQSPTAGLLEGCASQRDPQTLGHGGTPGLPDTRDWRPAQTKQQCMESEGEGGMAGVDKNRGLKTDEEAGQRGEAESSCRYTCLQDVTKPEGEEIQAKTDSLKTLWLSEQHLSTTHSGMSEYPQQSPQQTPNRSNNLHSPATSSQTGLFNPPQPSLEISNSYFSQHWESSITHNQQPQQLCDTHSSQHINTQAQSTGTQHDYSPLQTFSNQDQKQSSIPLCVQRRSTTTTVSCATAKLAPGSHIITSPDVKPSSSTNPGQVSCPVHVRWDTAGLTWDPQAPNSNMLDNNNTLLPSKLFSYPETADYQDTKDKAPNEYASHSSNFGRSDITNKYQSFFFSGQLHGFPAAECLSGGLRPVQSCQDYTEDTSSSDDEGKLIIEL